MCLFILIPLRVCLFHSLVSEMSFVMSNRNWSRFQKKKKEFLISVVINAYQCNNRIASIACIYNDDMHAFAHTNTELDFASSRQKILTHWNRLTLSRIVVDKLFRFFFFYLFCVVADDSKNKYIYEWVGVSVSVRCICLLMCECVISIGKWSVLTSHSIKVLHRVDWALTNKSHNNNLYYVQKIVYVSVVWLVDWLLLLLLLLSLFLLLLLFSCFPFCFV